MGHAWTIDIDVLSVERVFAVTGIHLLKTINGQLAMFAVAEDICDLMNVLWALVGEGRSPDDKAQFYRAMKGDVLTAAYTALLDDLVDFTPSPERRQMLRAAIKTMWELSDRQTKKIEAELEKVAKEPSPTATSLPESSGSIRQD